jgi:hypothetical protein
MQREQFLTLLGFAFVAAWIGFGFGDALLCLLGAAVAYGIGMVVSGDLDLAELQDRLRDTGTPAPRRDRARVR